MTEIALYGGPLKRELIKRGYGICGQSFTEYEITPEEYEAGLMCLDDTMAVLASQWGIDLGYNFPVTGGGSPEDESGIPIGAVKGVSYQLAQALAPTIGKALPADALTQLAQTWAPLLSTYGTTPHVELGRGTPRGAGNRLYAPGRPFFNVTLSDDETIQ